MYKMIPDAPDGQMHWVDDEPLETYCARLTCAPGSECPDCCCSMGAGCDHSEVHTLGTAPYAAGRDSEGDFACEECLAKDKEMAGAL